MHYSQKKKNKILYNFLQIHVSDFEPANQRLDTSVTDKHRTDQINCTSWIRRRN
jgi:hypothetical protein